MTGLNLVLLTQFTMSAAIFAAVPRAPQVEHVLIVEFENTDFSAAMRQSAFADLAQKGALLSNFFAEVHPSQPNYIAMIAGDTYGFKTDLNINIDERHIGDLLEEAGKTWKVYAEDYPGNCFLGARSGLYVRKHVPFLSFKNIQSNPARCANIVEAEELKQDLSKQTLPDFSLYIPNLKNDGHDTGVAYANDWLQNTFLKIVDSGQLPAHTLVIFTFDESSRTSDNHIYTSFYGDMVKPGSNYTQRIDHFGFLRTIESLLNIGNLGKKDAGTEIVQGIWQ